MTVNAAETAVLKLATWNVERARNPARCEALRAHVKDVAADVWVFTETNEAFTGGLGGGCSSKAGRDRIAGLDQTSDHWITICSKHRLEQLPTADEIRTAAARVFPIGKAPFLVVGTVLPWIGSKWREHPASGGVAFAEALKVQVSEWKGLQQRFPDDEFFVLGDFNQDLVEPRYYGSRANRACLAAALDDCGLVAFTAGDGDPIRRSAAPYACIDHICSLRKSRWRLDRTERWPETSKPDKRLSDHFGLAATLVLK